MLCESCKALVVNGTLCHETGCPNAWKYEARECKECGGWFKPEDKSQRFCTDSCWHYYNDGDWNDVLEND